MAQLGFATIPDDWLQDILIYLDFIHRHRILRCCRKWKNLLSNEFTRRTLIVTGPMNRPCWATRIVHPATVQRPARAAYRHSTAVFWALEDTEMVIRNVIFSGQLITPEAFRSYRNIQEYRDNYLRQYGSWVCITERLFSRSAGQLINKKSLPKVSVVFHEIPHVPWQLLWKCWAAERVASIDVKNTTIGLGDLWSSGYLPEVFPAFNTDAWMQERTRRLGAAKLERFNTALVSMDRRVCELSKVAFQQFLQESLPPPDAKQMKALLTAITTTDKVQFEEVLHHITEMTGSPSPLGEVPDSAEASSLDSMLPIDLWLLYAWIILK